MDQLVECHAELEDLNGEKAEFRGTVPEFICEALKLMNKFTMIRIGDVATIAIFTKTREDTREMAEAFALMIKMIGVMGG